MEDPSNNAPADAAAPALSVSVPEQAQQAAPAPAPSPSPTNSASAAAIVVNADADADASAGAAAGGSTGGSMPELEARALQRDALDEVLRGEAANSVEASLRTQLSSTLAKPTVSVPADIFLNNKPTAPCFWYYAKDTIFSLPAVYMDVTVTVHVSTAIVALRIGFVNSSPRAIDGVFALPVRGTVTSVSAKIGEDRFLQSEIIDSGDVAMLQGQLAPPRVSRQIPLENVSEYVPDLFRLPVMGVQPREVIQLDIEYVEALAYGHGAYGFNFPMRFAAGLAPDPRALTIRGSVFAMSPDVRILSASHALEVTDLGLHKRFKALAPTAEEIAQAQAQQAAAAAADASASAGAEGASAKDKEGATASSTIITNDGSKASATGVATDALQSQPSPLDLFNLHFELPLGEIAGSVLKAVMKRTEILGADGAVERVREEGSFLAFVAPPSVERVEKQFRRNFVFLLDRSGSMVGQPFEEALRGLRSALARLGPYDRFNILAFDHNMMALHEDMVPATQRNVEVAFAWVREKKPTFGGTTLEAPLRWALSLLGKIQKGLNFVFLLTDGAVENDREICRMAVQAAGSTRILTIGIGTACNWYFLQMLASLTRGFNANIVYQEQIFAQVSALLAMAELPVLTDLTLDMENVDDCQLYPFPLPDLFLGAPLVVAGKYSAVGGFPSGVMLRGDDAGGLSQMVYLPVTVDATVPVERVFLKQRMDLLVAKSWLDDSKSVRQEVIDLSIRGRLPSPFTTMVAFEMTAEEKARYEQDRQDAAAAAAAAANGSQSGAGDAKGGKQDDANTGTSGGSGLKDETAAKRAAAITLSQQMLANSERRAQYIAASAIGAVVAIGAVAAVFGDVGATMTNAASVVAGGFGTVAATAVEGCADCDCDCVGELMDTFADCC